MAAASTLLPLLSLRDVAAVLGVSGRTVRRLVSEGELEVVEVGDRRLLVEPDALAEFIAARRTRRRKVP
jgi:excisionase family DNA binding protein